MQNAKKVINNLKSKLSTSVVVPMTIIGILGGSNYYVYRDMNDKIDSLNQTIHERTTAVEQLKEDNAILTQQSLEAREQLIDTLQQMDKLQQIDKLQQHPIITQQYTPANKPAASYINYESAMVMEATCYNSDESGGQWTADGTFCADLPFDARFVASNDFPLGSRLYITCDSYPAINGEYTVRDRMAYSGVIDIWFGCDSSYEDMMDFGRRTIHVTYLG